MANELALRVADKLEVVIPGFQQDLVAAEALEAGQAVRIDTAGKATGANGTTTTENRIYGLALTSVAAGQAVTVMRKGVFDGFELAALAYDAIVYLSDTDGAISGTAGTVSTAIGRVVPGTATTLGTAYDKLLFLDL